MGLSKKPVTFESTITGVIVFPLLSFFPCCGFTHHNPFILLLCSFHILFISSHTCILSFSFYLCFSHVSFTFLSFPCIYRYILSFYRLSTKKQTNGKKGRPQAKRRGAGLIYAPLHIKQLWQGVAAINTTARS